MSPARFLRDFWQKRPLLIRGAFADLRNPVTPDDLAGLACEELALSRIAIHEPERDGWTLRSGPFTEADFAALPRTHWTLLVQDVDKWDGDVAALLDHFSFVPSWRIDDVMVSYAEDGGSVGAHVDQYDVFLLQGLGRRRWQLDMRVPRTDPRSPTRASQGSRFRDDTELKLLRAFAPTHEWLLEPGDMLYLPPGVPHHGVAVGACMTYSIGMRAPAQAELLGDFVDHLIEVLPEDARYADPDLMPARGDGEIDDDAIARVTRAMPWICAGGNAAERSALRSWFGRFITRYRSAQTIAAAPRRLGDAAFARALAHGAIARRNPWSRFAWLRKGRRAALFVAGERHICSLRFARRVCSQAEFPGAEVAAGDRPVLRALLDTGHLALVRPKTSRRPP